MSANPSFPLGVDFETGHPIAYPLARLEIGDTTARLFLLPDGVHIALDTDAKPFVHWIEQPDGMIGFGKLDRRDES